MKKIRMLIELQYDAKLMHSGEKDKEAKDWFFQDVLLGKERLHIVSDEIGDEIGTMKVLKIAH